VIGMSKMIDTFFKYKDFCGSVEYSAEDACFFGKMMGTSDLVTFEGDSVAALKEAFIEAVEDYLVLCQEVGKPPQKIYPFDTVRLSS
jgi:predicted HicB family RNase H-like nuclease